MESRCMQIFQSSCKTKATYKTFLNFLDTFLDWSKYDYESLLELDVTELENKLQDYVMYLKRRVDGGELSPNSIPANDNTADNPQNPTVPPRRVTAGNRSEDEMAHVWIQVLPRVPPQGRVDGRIILQETLMRQRLRKYPDEFGAPSHDRNIECRPRRYRSP